LTARLLKQADACPALPSAFAAAAPIPTTTACRKVFCFLQLLLLQLSTDATIGGQFWCN